MGEELFEIVAHEVTVEVRDEKTGQVFRRELPIDYFENANFLRLSGENMLGPLDCSLPSLADLLLTSAESWLVGAC